MADIPTWKEAMTKGILPVEFVQWAVQQEGGLPDGPIRPEDYERLGAEWLDDLLLGGDA